MVNLTSTPEMPKAATDSSGCAANTPPDVPLDSTALSSPSLSDSRLCCVPLPLEVPCASLQLEAVESSKIVKTDCDLFSDAPTSWESRAWDRNSAVWLPSVTVPLALPATCRP